jgi:hypothetical protein
VKLFLAGLSEKAEPIIIEPVIDIKNNLIGGLTADNA